MKRLWKCRRCGCWEHHRRTVVTGFGAPARYRMGWTGFSWKLCE